MRYQKHGGTVTQILAAFSGTTGLNLDECEPDKGFKVKVCEEDCQQVLEKPANNCEYSIFTRLSSSFKS